MSPNESEKRAGAMERETAERMGISPRRIKAAAREGYTDYGGYRGPRRSEQWGRYDLGHRRGYDRGWINL